MSEPLKIALAGLGTVGVGVVEILRQNAKLLADRTGRSLELVAVSARDRQKDRGIDLTDVAWHENPADLAKLPNVDLVVEAIGGAEGAAKSVVSAALDAGKHVVSANKALLAEHGLELAKQADARSVALRFEAAVAGGIPVVKALTEGLAANEISRVMGVMNGTCNYILTQMESSGASYDDVLADAQHLGYAEADPAFDVGGIDAAQKLALLASIAFGTEIRFNDMEIEGIEQVTLTDIRHARDMGYAIKLLGTARKTENGLEQRMQPCLVPAASPLGQLDGVTNMVVIEGQSVGQTVYQGPGAGRGPTASAVVADIVDVARGIVFPPLGIPTEKLVSLGPDNGGPEAAYYLRLTLADQPGTLATVAATLGQQGISINRMRQVTHAGDEAPVLIVTHACHRHDIDRALQRIAALEVSTAPPVAYRIEEV